MILISRDYNFNMQAPTLTSTEREPSSSSGPRTEARNGSFKPFGLTDDENSEPETPDPTDVCIRCVLVCSTSFDRNLQVENLGILA